MTPERITIMGIGNQLMRDEGVGVRVAEVLGATLEFPDNVNVLDAGTMGMGILHLFSECDFMLVVDAVDGTGEPAGTVVRMSPDELAPNQVLHSLHDVRLVDVLSAASLMGTCPETECIGIQIADMAQMEIGLTPRVERAVPSAVAAVLTVLAERGVVATPRGEASADSEVLRTIRTSGVTPEP
jgi:hydrogenase maturation protease